MRIIGITGTLGAGKGTVVEYLVAKKGFAHYSVRDFLTQEIKRRNMPVTRDSMVTVANDLRAVHSPSYIVECLYEQAAAIGFDCIIESVRTTGEVAALRKKGAFSLLAVDADRKLRYERIIARNSETDRVSFSEFSANEEREMYSSDPGTQNIAGCMQLADNVILNNGSPPELHENVENFLHEIKKKERAH